MPAQLKLASPLKTGLDHLKNHVQYPLNKKGLVQACNEMQDVNEGDRAWFIANIPEGTYRAPEDVLRALLTKV